MSLDSKGKRIGLVLFLCCLAVLALLAGLLLMEQYYGVSIVDSIGKSPSEVRGSANALLHEWFGIVLLVFPLIACAVLLMLCFDRNILDWIKNGRKKEPEDEEFK